MQTGEEDANFTDKGPNLDSNQNLIAVWVTVLAIRPPCHLYLVLLVSYFYLNTSLINYWGKK